MEPLQVVLETEPRPPALDAGIARALLQRVAAGELPATLRLARPAPAVVFGKQDTINPGYAAAARATREAGFEPILRLAGGRAAVFCEQTISLSHAVPDPAPRRGIHARFEATAALIAAALRRLGLDARVGEVPGEYCPGVYSVNVAGERKLAGIGQRLVARASYLGGVLVVADSARVRDVLTPVYAALGLDWAPSTTGAVVEEPAFRAAADDAWLTVRDALLAEYADRYELVEVELEAETLELADRLVAVA